jgi:hypothetical protein
MVNRLKPLNMMDFTGGVNLRPEAFQLAENELPEMINLEVDPRGGINTRKGWRYTTANQVKTGPWNPRNAYTHRDANGNQWTYVTAANNLYGALPTGAWSNVTTPCTADPHQADFASWDDLVYVARGRANASAFIAGLTATTLTVSAAANWQNDYTAPGATDTFPAAELIAQHQGYMFVAGTREDSVDYPNRVRWSHPNNPRRWAKDDYIDISEGGQRITAIIPFTDRLLVFKPDAVWALFGYSAETWEMTNVSRTIGCLNQQTVARSEDAVFFLSWPQGVFAYTGTQISELSVQIRTVFMDNWIDPSSAVNSWVGWVGRRLWVSLPYSGKHPGPDDAATAFVWDPVMSSWTMFRGADNDVPGPYVERVETNTEESQVAFVRLSPYAVSLDYVPGDATDECVPGEVRQFTTHMRTRWIDAGSPTWKKSWRRPDFLLRAVTVDASLNVQVFHDFDNYNAQRHFMLAYTPDAQQSVYGTFNWGDGTEYGGSTQTSSVERGSTMGRAGTVQLQIDGYPGVQWGLNGIIFKYIPRRFR